eukprot:COSAG04_NODE_16950_length_484_cov_0.802597_1_plen_35_part_10
MVFHDTLALCAGSGVNPADTEEGETSDTAREASLE